RWYGAAAWITPYCLQFKQVCALDFRRLDTEVLKGLFLGAVIEHHHQCGELGFVDNAVHIPKSFSQSMTSVVTRQVNFFAPIFNQVVNVWDTQSGFAFT